MNNEFVFMAELLMDNTEKGFVQALYKNPKDVAARNAYIDWLLEHGRLQTADKVREGWSPFYQTSYSGVAVTGSIYPNPYARGLTSGFSHG